MVSRKGPLPQAWSQTAKLVTTSALSLVVIRESLKPHGLSFSRCKVNILVLVYRFVVFSMKNEDIRYAKVLTDVKVKELRVRLSGRASPRMYKVWILFSALG